ncbi:hypothetical protein RYX56_08230 [Alkalihalophilus lindianensis]|uniref:Uncharacterized protein n=1 Tax=Alkalihalophilus lindianensis TaxID=1630542 RepID=A0ABU3X8Z0_9BACI|nr:hypothetical protein [Alkalihalophilus lindianensis]MDV2684355.1 hypothetical protein [Alkalihalophilus lindianensis]
MSTLKEATNFTEQHLKDLLQHLQTKGTEDTELTSAQLVEEIASVFKPFINHEEV